MTVTEMVQTMARDARVAARTLRTLTRGQKDRALMRLVDLLDQERANVAAVNAADVAGARENGLSAAMIDRLTLSPEVINAMIDGLQEVAALPDPVGEVLRSTRRPNGLTVGRCRIPLGVIGFIYESRPNVTVDAAALCLKSGNAVILKGGSEALRSNLLLAELIQKALEQTDIPAAAVQVVPTPDRTAVQALLALEEDIDLIIPRGGEGLIRYVVQNAAIPVLKHYKGVCHVYVDRWADLAMAEEISFNAKVQRPGVCNAMETLLVHEGVAAEFLPSMLRRFEQAGVALRGCEKTRQWSAAVTAATKEDWPEEFHDLILAVKVAPDMDAALDHIDRYGTRHTEAIVTRDYSRARRFLTEVDSSAVLVNASTRFNDGSELGLGAEIGISTSKLHAFGPMGLTELTTTKFIVTGDGQIRE